MCIAWGLHYITNLESCKYVVVDSSFCCNWFLKVLKKFWEVACIDRKSLVECKVISTTAHLWDPHTLNALTYFNIGFFSQNNRKIQQKKNSWVH